ncbi:hypothetical protein HK103_004310 [Boothiomyces macroporosus]|uniref:Uncharacterized protein n=1 Tax=Boothiomyces macroporosus TaxID=261099 RepID=A0AAD5UH95_9FUNG|nr:hypothetical protein HK103_004310 [Boothiomyces macroporosus]
MFDDISSLLLGETSSLESTPTQLENMVVKTTAVPTITALPVNVVHNTGTAKVPLVTSSNRHSKTLSKNSTSTSTIATTTTSHIIEATSSSIEIIGDPSASSPTPTPTETSKLSKYGTTIIVGLGVVAMLFILVVFILIGKHRRVKKKQKYHDRGAPNPNFDYVEMAECATTNPACKLPQEGLEYVDPETIATPPLTTQQSNFSFTKESESNSFKVNGRKHSFEAESRNLQVPEPIFHLTDDIPRLKKKHTVPAIHSIPLQAEIVSQPDYAGVAVEILTDEE